MTATEVLRRMLDERGIEWWKASPCKTKWHSPVLGGPVAVREWNGEMVLDAGYVNVTPEQAIAATVGTGTCGLKKCETTWFEKGETTWFAGYNGYVTEWTCDECGGLTFYDAEMRPRFCANCGRKAAE